MNRSRSLADFHNMVWASALAGTSGTALARWWARLDERDHYPLYRPLSRFLADVPWTGGELQSFTSETAGCAVRVIGRRTRCAVWVWCFHRAAAWRHLVTEGRAPPPVRGAEIALESWEAGEYRLTWWDTREGRELASATVTTQDGRLALTAPEFTYELALKVSR